MNGSRETFIPDPKLTEEFRRYCTEECGIDLLGIADVNRINENARPGRRACDLYPAARAVLVIGVGLLDPFTRGWVRSGNSGPFYSLALLELERRCWLIRRFLRQKGYQCYGGDAYGGGLFSCGSRFSNIAESWGISAEAMRWSRRNTAPGSIWYAWAPTLLLNRRMCIRSCSAAAAAHVRTPASAGQSWEMVIFTSASANA